MNLHVSMDKTKQKYIYIFINFVVERPLRNKIKMTNKVIIMSTISIGRAIAYPQIIFKHLRKLM